MEYLSSVNCCDVHCTEMSRRESSRADHTESSRNSEHEELSGRTVPGLERISVTRCEPCCREGEEKSTVRRDIVRKPASAVDRPARIIESEPSRLIVPGRGLWQLNELLTEKQIAAR